MGRKSELGEELGGASEKQSGFKKWIPNAFEEAKGYVKTHPAEM